MSERLSERPDPNLPWVKAWKREEWNTVRARIEGDVPHIQAWINDQPVLDFTDTANHAMGGIAEGPITSQLPSGRGWSMPSHISLVEPFAPEWPS